MILIRNITLIQMLSIQSQFETDNMSDRKPEDNLEYMAADDEIYRPMQEEIFKGLIQTESTLQKQLVEAIQFKKSIETEKEDIGVRLYNAQQQLAADQMDYEKAHQNFNIAQRLRIQSEQKLSQINEIYNSKKQQNSVLKNKVNKSQKQLETLMRNFHEIEAYNLQLKSDIAVTKIETFTAEENVANLQKIKKKQDLLIDSMNEESKRLEEQKNILSAQIISQKEQTEEAKRVLREAESEMEKVVSSKKGLLERWQKSLTEMQKRDGMIQAAKNQFTSLRQRNILLQSELNGLRNQIRKEEENTENLNMLSDRISKQKNSIELKKQQLLSLEAKTAMQMSALKSSLASTEDQIKLTSQEEKTVQNAMNIIETNIMKLHTETKNLYEKLIDQKSEHTTIEKTASNLLKQAHKLSYEIEEKEMELENIKNQIARVKIDQLNTKSQIQLLEGKRAEAIKEQEEKKFLVISYEVQIKQGHDINEKKQHQVGRLNKLHDQLKSKANDQGKNHLQTKLMNLERETEELQKNCSQLYRDWIKKQTELVSKNNELEQLRQNVTNLENKKTIVQQKKVRLNNNYQVFEKEIAATKISLKGLQQEMNRLNDKLAVHADKKHKLENQNVNLESEFVEKLKEMEREAVKLEIDIDSIRQQKSELMNEIVECQRQILLWQRKYQLEKQVQETLDPNVGRSEIQQLTKELHRMQLKYQSLLKSQDKVMTEIQRVVRKKQDIEMKHRDAVKKQPLKAKKQPQNSIQLKKTLQKLRDNLGKIMRNLQQSEKTLARRENDLENIGQTLEQHNDDYKKLEGETHGLETEQVLAKIKKNVDILQIASMQKKYKKCEELANKTAKLAYQEPILRQKLEEIKEKNNDLFGVVQNFMQKYTQYAQLFVPLFETHKIDAKI